jgi:hypothetical protein
MGARGTGAEWGEAGSGAGSQGHRLSMGALAVVSRTGVVA